MNFSRGERHGRALLKLPTSDLQNKVLDNVIKNGLNVKKTIREELIEKELLILASKNMPSKTGKRLAVFFLLEFILTLLNRYSINVI